MTLFCLAPGLGAAPEGLAAAAKTRPTSAEVDAIVPKQAGILYMYRSCELQRRSNAKESDIVFATAVRTFLTE